MPKTVGTSARDSSNCATHEPDSIGQLVVFQSSSVLVDKLSQARAFEIILFRLAWAVGSPTSFFEAQR